MIWIIGGTSEARQFLEKLPGNLDKIITVTTEDGKKALISFARHIQVVFLDEKAMMAFVLKNHITMIVDLSHPYAVEVSKNAVKVSETYQLPYFRFVRSRIIPDSIKQFDSISSCADFLKTVIGNVFFTTGVKSIPDFEAVRESNRFIYRILPSFTSFEMIKNLDLDMKNIVAMLGPFSFEMNVALFKQFDAEFVVMKNAGKNGGTDEKIQACEHTGAVPLIVDRPKESGYSNLEVLLSAVLACK